MVISKPTGQLVDHSGQNLNTTPVEWIYCTTFPSNQKMCTSLLLSRLESKCQTEPGSPLQGLGVQLTRDGQGRLRPQLVLQKSPELPGIVEPCLYSRFGIQCMLPADGDCVLIGGEPSNKLSNHGAFLHLIQMVHIRSSKSVSLVRPDKKGRCCY